jgi:tyrosyl-tRNA synthetase
VHGQARSDSVKRIIEVLFGGRDYSELPAEDFKELGEELGVFSTNSGVDLVTILTESNLASSKGEARRFIESGAVYVNGVQASELLTEKLIHGYAIVRRGKNTQTVVKVD